MNTWDKLFWTWAMSLPIIGVYGIFDILNNINLRYPIFFGWIILGWIGFMIYIWTNKE